MSPTPRPVPPIVSADWLADRGGDVVICEVGSSMTGGDPEAEYAERHISAARYVSLDTVLAAPPSAGGGRHPLPTPDGFALHLGALGVDDDATVVAYDRRAGGGFAGRLVWMLRTIGQPAALLDGGLDGWTGSVESEPVTVDPVDRTPRPWPADALADADDVARHIRAGGVVIDSRDPARYAGDVEPIDAVAGHIPGAINLVYTANLDADSNFRPTAILAERFAVASADDDPIVYCGSGVTACHNALVMEHVGLPRPRLYVGSWSAWSSDPDRPVATGQTP
ncbi:MAG TPA: sulfurtransferase [Ilumatobacteraceae bacterium]|nr:sulfurtransferase [Ilumatobacteraceae bacterium]